MSAAASSPTSIALASSTSTAAKISDVRPISDPKIEIVSPTQSFRKSSLAQMPVRFIVPSVWPRLALPLQLPGALRPAFRHREHKDGERHQNDAEDREY